MRLKTVVKLGTVVSVLLFCLAVGYYAFMRLGFAERNRSANLFSLVPSTCLAVLESGHMDAFLHEYPNYNYGPELERFQFPGLFNFLVSGMNEYVAHGRSSRMNQLLVSFHEPATSRDQVLYFQVEAEGEQVLGDMLHEYLPSNFYPKEEEYRGEVIRIYPLSSDEFLSAYMDNGFVVLSYQKRLIEAVIDAMLDQESLGDDPLFTRILERKKSSAVLTLYGHAPSLPFLKTESDCWSEYEFHLNSDVAYLTGNTFVAEETDGFDKERMLLDKVPVVNEEGVMVSSDRDSTSFYINQVLETAGEHTLFHGCIANLSNEASFSLVADMQKVEENPERFQDYLPSFLLNNANLFRSFILSVQLSQNGTHPSHLWVFTYKY